MAVTNKDIDKMKEVFANKEQIDRKFEEMNKKFDKVLIGQDKIMGELEKAREDRIFAKAKDDEQDSRLLHLEAKVGAGK